MVAFIYKKMKIKFMMMVIYSAYETWCFAVTAVYLSSMKLLFTYFSRIIFIATLGKKVFITGNS